MRMGEESSQRITSIMRVKLSAESPRPRRDPDDHVFCVTKHARQHARSCFGSLLPRDRDRYARSTLATMSKQHCRSNRQLCCLLLRQCCSFGQQCRSNVRLCRKDEISTQQSFDIVAGVDRALVVTVACVAFGAQGDS